MTTAGVYRDLATQAIAAITSIPPEIAGLNAFEESLFDPALARILQRLPQSAVENFSRVTDPLIVLYVVGLWGNRLRELVAFQKEVKKRAAQNPNVAPTFTQNGVAPDHIPT